MKSWKRIRQWDRALPSTLRERMIFLACEVNVGSLVPAFEGA